MILAFALFGMLGAAQVRAEKKVAYLGVATANVDESMKSQLGIASGVTVVDVREDGPSAGILEKHDILTKMDDQILFNPEQLTDLLGLKKKGDRVTFAVIRKGASQTQSVILGDREEAKTGPGGPAFTLDRLNIDLPEALPAEARQAIEEALKNAGAGAKVDSSVRIIINGKEVTVPGNGAQSFSQSSSSTVWSDGQRSYQIARNNGKTTVKVTEDGRIVHEGPFDSAEDRKKFPREIREKLEEIDTKVGVPAGKDNQQGKGDL